MILFGHKLIQSPRFIQIETITAVEESAPNDILYTEFSSDKIALFEHLRHHRIPFGIVVSSIGNFILAIQFNPNYVLVDKAIVLDIQKITNGYLLDTKILLIIDSEVEFEWVAKHEIDGVVFRDYLV